MKKIYRFRYRRNKTVCKDIIIGTEYGEANVEVYGLADIEDLMRVSGLNVHDVFIVPSVRNAALQTRHGIWNERNLVFATKGKRRTVCIGECNFYEGNGK